MKNWAKQRGILTLGALSTCVACGSAVDDAEAGGPTGVTQDGIVEIQGRAFMRRDLWSQADFDRILYEGRADQPSSTPEVLAAQLRAHTTMGSNYYIELDLNVELAKKILSGEVAPGTPSSQERQARTVIGSDTRVAVTATTTVPATTFAFNESRGSGVRISQNVLYTAAHVVYETIGPNSWFCHNGTTTPGCSRPRWRFGVNGAGAFAGWTPYNCDIITIPTAFVTLTGTGNETDWGHFDFAVVNLVNCTNKGNTGWLGTWPATDQELLNISGYQAGYPARATCPAGANADTGYTTNGTNVLGTDCPGTGNWPGNTYRLINTVAPYAGAQAFLTSTGDIWAGSAYTIRSTVDLTHGNSGGPLYTILSSNDRRVIGVSSLATQTYNVFNRWTTEIHNWFITYSPFPN